VPQNSVLKRKYQTRFSTSVFFSSFFIYRQSLGPWLCDLQYGPVVISHDAVVRCRVQSHDAVVRCRVQSHDAVVRCIVHFSLIRFWTTPRHIGPTVFHYKICSKNSALTRLLLCAMQDSADLFDSALHCTSADPWLHAMIPSAVAKHICKDLCEIERKFKIFNLGPSGG
jgi:hypothetical protein